MSNRIWSKWVGLASVLTLGATIEGVALASPALEKGGEQVVPVGEKGDLALGLEQMSRVWYGSDHEEFVYGDIESTGYGATGPNLGMLAVDYFVAESLSLGGSVGMWGGASEGGGWSSDRSNISISPRIGYALSLGATEVWLRAGLGYAFSAYDTDQSGGGSFRDTTHTVSLGAEPALLVPIYKRTYMTLSPSFAQSVFFGDATYEGEAHSPHGWGYTVALAGGVTVVL